MTGARRSAFTFVLFAAMGASTFTAASLGIVATFIIDDLGIDRAQLGFVVAANTVLAALLSPLSGRITDAVGGKRAIAAVFVGSALAYAAFGLATAYWMLFSGSLFGAWSQSGGNPSTNKLIAEDLPPGERGVVTGIKQSGVQAAVFLGGVTLPSLAIGLGWRGAYLVVASLPAVLAVTVLWAVPRTPQIDHAARRLARGPLPAAITWLAAYGLLFGFAGAIGFLIPLFAEESLGYSPRAAGLAAAVVGMTAFAARIGWARRADRTGDYHTPLTVMAWLGVAAALVMAAAPAAGALLLWPGAVLVGVSTSAWNSVGMLAVMDEAGSLATGRASGIVLFGFMTGLGAGAPVFGAVVDRFGYAEMWLLSGAVALLTLLLTAAWSLSRRRMAQ